MARRYGRYRKRRFRKIKRRPARRYKRRFRRSYKSKKTSQVVCLTSEFNWFFINSSNEQLHDALTFTVHNMPGFLDYQTVYSHFRILKAKAVMATQYGDTKALGQTSYLVIGSRPFAASQRPLDRYPAAVDFYLPAVSESDLRQARWQRMHYPSTTTQAISATFYPYTMLAALGPAYLAKDAFFQRIWEGRRWMPFSWAWNPKTPNSDSTGLTFFGPYMVRNIANATGVKLPDTLTVQLRVWFQFKGQK
ncbi:capsid protein [Dipodfec virus UA06Rod_111]|uniref:Capsid protein n=1 Tax=Dipodfec virus UA06Rod_111 TaxID=2929275 RepID=A0A976N2M6_9VIRU|nr:capsid protein [Dipodfec virus UA06Rod_111]